MRRGLLAAACLACLAASAQAQPPILPLPPPDNLPTILYGSDLSRIAPPNPTDFFPLTRLKRLGPGSDEAPRSYTGYGTVEWLWWWTRDQRPPLLFTQGDHHVGDGGLSYDNQERLGFRLTAGWWLNNNQTLGVEGSYLQLWRREPNVVLIGSDLLRSDDTSVAAGRVSNASRVWGLELNGRCELARWTGGHLDGLVGVRHFQLEENLDIAALGLDGIATHDRFGSHNQFWGGQLGLQGEVNCGPWSASLYGKVGLGVNHQVTDAEGSRIIGEDIVTGGFYAQESNIG